MLQLAYAINQRGAGGGDITMLLTKLAVSPECQIACAKPTPGAWLESTSCKIKKATVYEDKHLHKNHIKLKSGHQLAKDCRNLL